MIKDALAYIVGMRKPEIVQIGDETYSDKALERISYNPMAKPIELTTLTSLIDYIRTMSYEFGARMIIHIHNPQHVSMYSELDNDRTRECLVDVRADLPETPDTCQKIGVRKSARQRHTRHIGQRTVISL